MNDNLKNMLVETLKQYSIGLINDTRDIETKLKEFNDVDNIMKILQNYVELEPLLKKFFQEKAEKNKWERGN
jgi:hypothetical protein